MNAPAKDQENRAALVFIGVLGLLTGIGGVLVAAAAVGLQRAWSGMEPRSRGEGWRKSVADHRAWLDMDRKARDGWRAERQAWWRDGADPAKRPVQDPVGKRVGGRLRRTWARTAVGTDRTAAAVGRFLTGFREGWATAQDVRRDGGAFRDIANARPAAGVADAEQQPAAPAVVDQQPAPPPAEIAPLPAAEPSDTEHQGVVDAINGTSTEDTMTAPTTSTPARAAAPAGETHLDLTDAGLADVKGTLAQISETVDILAQLRSTLAGQVSALNERVTANGGTAETTQSLDAAMSVINQIGDQVGRLSESAVEAADVTDAAQAGLAPARDAQDALHAAGGRGDFVATAHSD